MRKADEPGAGEMDKYCFVACVEQSELGHCPCTRRQDREIERQMKRLDEEQRTWKANSRERLAP